MTSPDHLAERYGAPPRGRRRLLQALGGALLVGALGWLAWTTFVHANPRIASTLVSFDVVDDHEATAVVQVELGDELARGLRDGSAQASCTLRAFAEDHTTVGELTWVPAATSGRTSLTLRTERLATSVESLGCTTEGQPRPR